MGLLAPEQIERELGNLPGWERRERAIVKEFRFPAYLDGIAFVDRVAHAAEEANHHPDITVGYRKVVVELSSHDAGGVTHRDIKLARQIEDLAGTA